MIKKIANYIRMKYHDLSYQNKLVIAIFTIILLPIIFLSSYSYTQNANLIKKHAITISKLYLDQVQNSIDSYLDELANTAMILSRYDNVTSIVEKDPAKLSISEQLADLRNLDILVSGFIASEAIYDIRIYVNEGFIYSNRGVTTYNIQEITPQQWSMILLDNSPAKYYHGPYTYTYSGNNSQRIISFMIPIRSSTNFDQVISLISVDMKESELHRLMSVADYTQHGMILISDQEYQTVANYSENQTDEYQLTNMDRLKSLNEQIEDAPSTNALVDDNHIIGVASLSNSWKLISIISIEDLLTVQSDMRYQFFALVLVAIFVVYLIAYVYAGHNASRINALSRQFRVVESGDFNVSCIVDSSDEIGGLQTSFNYMVKEINALMKKQYQSGRDLNMMELKVLQAQINPHFLYNTLDLILWTAKRNDMDQVSDIIIRLSRYYRISLSNGSDYIDLQEELEHARLYVELQNLRFTKKVELSINIEEALLSVKIMKLLLQPIVENSIHHGIAYSNQKHGLISIVARQIEEDLQIIITDNGVGMDGNVISFLKVYQNMRDANGYIGGFGLKNVLDRLRLYYDNKAQISFESISGSGTKVTIIMPLNRQKYMT